MQKRDYTQKEVDFLLANCETMTRREMAEALGRQTASVTQKLLRMNTKPITFKKSSSNTWVKMFIFAKELNPKYQKVTDAFDDYGMRNFIKLYKQK